VKFSQMAGIAWLITCCGFKDMTMSERVILNLCGICL
jgi:hypothetical protein